MMIDPSRLMLMILIAFDDYGPTLIRSRSTVGSRCWGINSRFYCLSHLWLMLIDLPAVNVHDTTLGWSQKKLFNDCASMRRWCWWSQLQKKSINCWASILIDSFDDDRDDPTRGCRCWSHSRYMSMMPLACDLASLLINSISKELINHWALMLIDSLWSNHSQLMLTLVFKTRSTAEPRCWSINSRVMLIIPLVLEEANKLPNLDTEWFTVITMAVAADASARIGKTISHCQSFSYAISVRSQLMPIDLNLDEICKLHRSCCLL